MEVVPRRSKGDSRSARTHVINENSMGFYSERMLGLPPRDELATAVGHRTTRRSLRHPQPQWAPSSTDFPAGLPSGPSWLSPRSPTSALNAKPLGLSPLPPGTTRNTGRSTDHPPTQDRPLQLPQKLPRLAIALAPPPSPPTVTSTELASPKKIGQMMSFTRTGTASSRVSGGARRGEMPPRPPRPSLNDAYRGMPPKADGNKERQYKLIKHQVRV